jgi:hypothetical protein
MCTHVTLRNCVKQIQYNSNDGRKHGQYAISLLLFPVETRNPGSSNENKDLKTSAQVEHIWS